jgi:lysozyme
MQLSYAGGRFLEEREGFKAFAYRDTNGTWTIGFGTTVVDGKPVEQGMTCSRPQASAWMDRDTALVQTAINKVVRVPITQNQFDALVSFVYNIGIGAFLGSTMLKMINAAAMIDAAAQFKRWDKETIGGKLVANKGLHARRLLEQSLFEK